MTPLRCLALSLLVAFPVGCDDKAPRTTPPPQGKRSEVVQARTTAAPPASSPAATPSPRPAAPRPPVCSTAPAAAGRSLPAGALPHLEAPGTAPLPGRIPTGGGQWTWVNLWAAWCKPCKEEIPLLRSWEAQLAQAGTPFRLAFVSLDDDERQARKFLEEQPPGGLRASWWLEEGKGRVAWLEAFQFQGDPRLPLHFLFDPKGTLRCVIDGAVEPVDLPVVRALLVRR